MTDIIVGLVIAAILGSAITYIVKQKKKGVKCIGCPDSGACSGNCSGCGGNCGMTSETPEEKTK